MDDQQFHASLDALLDREMSWMGPGSASGSVDGQLYAEDSMPTMSSMLEEHGNGACQSITTSETASLPRNDMITAQSQSEASMMSTIREAFPRLAGAVGQPSPLTARLGTVPLPLTLSQLTALTTTPASMADASATHHVAPSPVPTMEMNKPGTTTGKRFRSSVSASSAVSEDEDEKIRRRYDRNVREQQRSHKITEQIDFLKEVLSSAKVPFKPNKFSVLYNVGRYIEQLQERSSTLDAEHKKLLDTITRTNDLVNRHLTHQVSDGSTVNDSGEPQPDSLMSQMDDEAMVFVQGLDYKGVFRHCGVALAVASIDGRFLDCNQEFVDLTGFKRKELIPSEFESDDQPDQVESLSPVLKARKTGESSSPSPPKNLSMFNVLTRQDMEIVFLAMSDMLKRLVDMTKKPTLEPKDYWSGQVKLSRRKDKTVRH